MDLYLFRLINNYALKWHWLDLMGKFCAQYLGYFLVLILIVLLFIKPKKYWKLIIRAGTAAIAARFVFVEIIRWLFPRPRPFLQLQNVNLLLKDVDHIHHSFPSGHATFFFALATSIYLYNKKFGYFFLLSAFLISLARVFIGVHWPSDVVIGSLVGIFSAVLIHKAFKS